MSPEPGTRSSRGPIEGMMMVWEYGVRIEEKPATRCVWGAVEPQRNVQVQKQLKDDPRFQDVGKGQTRAP